MTENLEYMLPLYCVSTLFSNFSLKVSNLLFEYQFSNGAEISTFACVGIVIGIINALIPMQDFNIALYPTKESTASDKAYDSIDIKEV